MSTSPKSLLLILALAVVNFIAIECRSYENGLIFYDLKSHRPYLPPTVSVSRGRVLANVKFSNLGSIWSTFGRRCDCAGAKCGCCAGVSIKQYKFDQKMCANVTYVPRKEEALLEVYLNEKPSAMYGVSVRNPSPFCIPVMMGVPMAMCIQMTDIAVVGNNLNMCMDFVVRLATTDLFEMHFQCMRMGVDGFQYLDHNGQPVIPPGSNIKEGSQVQNDGIEYNSEKNEEQASENENEDENEDLDSNTDSELDTETDIDVDADADANEISETEDEEIDEEEKKEEKDEEAEEEGNRKKEENKSAIPDENNAGESAEENEVTIEKEEEISPITVQTSEANATNDTNVTTTLTTLPTITTTATSAMEPNVDTNDSENTIDDHENDTDEKSTQPSEIADEADIAQSYDTSNAIELATMQALNTDTPNESDSTTIEPSALAATESTNEVNLNSTISTFIAPAKPTEAAITITTKTTAILDNLFNSSVVSSELPVARRKRLPKLYRRSRE